MTRILNIFDCDDVKANFLESYLELVNTDFFQRTGKNPDFKVEDVDSWNFETKSPIIIQKAARVGLQPGWFTDYLKRFSHASFYASLPLIPGAKEAVEHFKENNSNVVVVTDRINSLKKEDLMSYDELLNQKKLEHKIQEDTFLWYNLRLKNLFAQREIYFVNGNTKQNVIEGFKPQYDVIILVEDNYKHAFSHASNSARYSFLLNRRYNQGNIVDRLVRIKGYKSDEFDTSSQFQELVERIDDLTKRLTS